MVVDSLIDSYIFFAFIEMVHGKEDKRELNQFQFFFQQKLKALLLFSRN